MQSPPHVVMVLWVSMATVTVTKSTMVMGYTITKEDLKVIFNTG